MIFLDANVFLRYLGTPATEKDAARADLAESLLEEIESNRQPATTSEVVLHEVCYALIAPRHYGYPPADVASEMRRIIQFPGFRFPTGERERYLRAFDLMAEHPRLGFADSVIAARCEAAGHDLATFDRHFDAVPTLRRWSWETPTA